MTKILLRLIGILITLYIGYGLISQTNLSATPHIVIDASLNDSAYVMNVEVDKPALYMVNFDIYSDKIHAQNRFGYPMQRRIERVSNYGMYNNYDLPMTFDVTLKDLHTNEVILNSIIVHPHTSAGGGGRYAILFQDTLDKGDYKINVKVIKADPDLKEFFTMLTFQERTIK